MRREEGVSPVIAELLMIAVTIILVASVYMMVTNGIISTPYGVNQLNGTLIINYAKSNSTTLYIRIILNHPSKALPNEVKIIITSSGKSAILHYKGNLTWSNETKSSKWYYKAKLIDNDGDRKFSNEDSLVITIIKNSSSINTPTFKNGDRITFSIDTYSGSSAGGLIEF